MGKVGTVLAIGCALGGGVGCGHSAPPGVNPNTAYSVASDISAKAKLAETNLEACKADNTQCDPVFAGLHGIEAQAASLQQTAIASGAKPQ
jgi:hypothetical protein